MGKSSAIKKAIKRLAKAALRESRTPVSVSVVTVGADSILAGRKAVITGGSRGIGFAIAKKLHNCGADVLITGRNEASLREASKTIGNRCHWLVSNAADAENAEEFIADCSASLDGLDILVLNAGISLHEASFREVTCDTFDAQVAVNFRGVFFLARAFLLYAEKNNPADANILIISSETGDEFSERPYGLTKAAINSMVGGFSRRVCREDIRVNALSPGVTVTDMISVSGEAKLSSVGDLSSSDFAAGRLFLPEEVAEVACFLVSPAARCISGEVIHCNRGNHLPVSRYLDDSERWRSLSGS